MVLVGMAWACSSLRSTPGETVSLYLTAISAGKYDDALQYLSSKDRPLFKAKLDKMVGAKSCGIHSWDVLSLNVGEHVASVEVRLTMTDLGSSMGKSLAGAIRSELFPGHEGTPGGTDKKSKPEGVTTSEYTFRLIRENEGWRISLGLEERARITAIIKEAMDLKSRGQKQKAVERLNEALQIDQNSGLVKYLLEHWQQEGGEAAKLPDPAI